MEDILVDFRFDWSNYRNVVGQMNWRTFEDAYVHSERHA